MIDGIEKKDKEAKENHTTPTLNPLEGVVGDLDTLYKQAERFTLDERNQNMPKNAHKSPTNDFKEEGKENTQANEKNSLEAKSIEIQSNPHYVTSLTQEVAHTKELRDDRENKEKEKKERQEDTEYQDQSLKTLKSIDKGIKNLDISSNQGQDNILDNLTKNPHKPSKHRENFNKVKEAKGLKNKTKALGKLGLGLLGDGAKFLGKLAMPLALLQAGWDGFKGATDTTSIANSLHKDEKDITIGDRVFGGTKGILSGSVGAIGDLASTGLSLLGMNKASTFVNNYLGSQAISKGIDKLVTQGDDNISKETGKDKKDISWWDRIKHATKSTTSTALSSLTLGLVSKDKIYNTLNTVGDAIEKGTNYIKGDGLVTDKELKTQKQQDLKPTTQKQQDLKPTTQQQDLKPTTQPQSLQSIPMAQVGIDLKTGKTIKPTTIIPTADNIIHTPITNTNDKGIDELMKLQAKRHNIEMKQPTTIKSIDNTKTNTQSTTSIINNNKTIMLPEKPRFRVNDLSSQQLSNMGV